MKWYEDPIYYKMCEKAKEIQEHKQQGRHNFYKDVPKGRCFIPIWLPRQDQLQDMCIPAITNIMGRLIGLFYAFINPLEFSKAKTFEINYPKQFTSMEQLWLAFIMKEKYQKIWNGEDWEKKNDKSNRIMATHI